MNKIFHSLIFLCISFSLYAQAPEPCGTVELGPEREAFLKEFQTEHQHYTSGISEVTYHLPLSVHVVGEDNGDGYFPVSDVFRMICELNEQMDETGFYFYLKGDINYINNSAYYNHSGSAGGQMMNQYNVQNSVNIYIVNDPAGNCGYFSPWGNAVAIRKSCAAAGNTTVAHELGHFFSLPHTFSGWEGRTFSSNPIPVHQREKVDGSNCATTGDGFCDTPPDYVSYRWECPYTGPTLIDPNGDTVTPDATNYMAYSSDHCADKFSPMQMQGMRTYLLTQRSNLVTSAAPTYVDLDPVNLVAPADQATGIPVDQIFLDWDPVQGATHYAVNVYRFNPMWPEYEVVVTTDQVHLPVVLDPNITYRWTVKAVHPANTCETPGTHRSFSTSMSTGIEENTALNQDDFAMFPNPIAQNEILQVHFTSNATNNGFVEVVSTTGQVVYRESYSVVQGQNQLKLPVAEFAAGMYILRINSSENNFVRQFVVSK